MTRRTIGFIIASALSLLVAPLAAEAQPAGKVYRLGLLSITSSPTGPQSLLLTLALLEAFRQSLRDYGYVGGQNLIIEARWGRRGRTVSPT